MHRRSAIRSPQKAASGTKAHLAPPPISPQGHIRLYNDEQWEEFILEWVEALNGDYVQVKRFGGAGDLGADVVAFKSDQGLEGPWDCYQCKHYDKSLGFADAAPEILKVFRNVHSGEWTMPDAYLFLAPRGCSTQFNKLLSQPSKLRERFMADLDDPEKPLGRALGQDERDAIAALAASADFTVFKSVELLEVLKRHKETPYHAMRFGTPLAERPASDGPPDELKPAETRYVEQLLEVYRERHPQQQIGLESVSVDPDVGEHFQRQREAFYRAESLRVYARDSVPPGTFELLQDDIYNGVVEIVEEAHPDGWTRMSKVLTQSVSLALDHHTLVGVSDLQDRKGICHQLANADRVTWVVRP